LAHEKHQRTLPEEINGGEIAQQEAETKCPGECHLSKRLRFLQLLKWKTQRPVASMTGQTLAMLPARQ